MDSVAIRLKPLKYKKNTFTLKTVLPDKIHNAKQIRALMPNLIHSLDAASLTLLVKLFVEQSNHFQFYAIHDCFVVPCNKVPLLFDLLKAVYISIYLDDNYLRNFDQGLKKNIITHYGANYID